MLRTPQRKPELAVVTLGPPHFFFLVVKGLSPQEVGLPTQTSDTEDSVRMVVPLLQYAK